MKEHYYNRSGKPRKRRKLDDERCPVVGRFRLIPVDYVPIIERVLRERGLLVTSSEASVEGGGDE